MIVRDILLFSTENGAVYQSAFFGRLILTFKDYWMVFDKEGYLRFRNQVARLALCPAGRSMLASEGLRLIRENDGIELRLEPTEAKELVWLLDSAQYTLYAQEAGGRKSNETVPTDRNVKPLPLSEAGNEGQESWSGTRPMKFERAAPSCNF